MKCVTAVFAGLLAAAAWAEPSRAPVEWNSVQTNVIARWKSENGAVAGVVADPSRRTVKFLVEATGVAEGETVEFLAIGPLSDRAYESLFVTVASPADIAAAFDRAGVPRGVAPDPLRARLWPEGEKIVLSLAPYGHDTAVGAGVVSNYLRDAKASAEGEVLSRPLAWTGGERDAAGVPVAATNEPCAVFALYNHSPSLLLLDGIFDQSSAYGRFQAAREFVRGELFEVTASWDGKRRIKDVEVKLTADNAESALADLRRDAASFEVHARLAFDASVTVGRAAELAQAFALLDGAGVKMNGQAEGQFFFRAFLPEPEWRERKGRIFQPFEVHVAADGARTFTFVEEDWSGEGLDPVLKPRTTPFKDWCELPGLIAKTGDQGSKVAVMFVFAPKDRPVAALAPVVKAVGARITTFYVFGD